MKKINIIKSAVSAFLALSMLFSTGCGIQNIFSADRGTNGIKSIGCYDVTQPMTTIADNYAYYDAQLTETYTGFFNTEEYNFIDETGFLDALTNPLSTFSADVDTASYTNIRRMINTGADIIGSAIRLEEFLNYFNYNYEGPNADAPFGITTEMADCPWNENSKLLLIGLQTNDIDIKSRPSSNFVFLLDVSGSMASCDKLPLMQKAFSMLAEELDENDRVSIVTYAGREEVVLDGVPGNDILTIVSAIENLEANGYTAGEAGINKAYELAQKHFISGGNNRIILATDGDLNVGVSSEAELTRLISSKRDSGIYLSVLGFGSGNIKDNKMEALADNGNGNYNYIDSVFEAKKVLVNEIGGTLYTVAKDVKLQIEFNPAKVSGYRLIGYENRRLENNEFNDDTKDAGEIGQGHSVTAVYELILADTDSKLSSSEYRLKYQTATLTDIDELLTLKIRYKEPDGDISKLLEYPVLPSIYSETVPDNLKFASCVLEFGMLLRDSKYKGSSSYENILAMLSELEGFVSEDEYKAEFKELVNKMYKRSFS